MLLTAFFSIFVSAYTFGDQNFDVTDANWKDFIGKGRPVILRRYFSGCSALPTFDPSWNEASQMNEYVLFLNAECLNSYNAPKLCQMIQDDEEVTKYHKGQYVSPSHIIFEPNSQKPKADSYVGSRKDFLTSQGINEYIYKHLNAYPTDIPLRRLDAYSIPEFFNSTPYPAIYLYNSSKVSHSVYLNKLATISNEEYPTPERTAIGFLDCNKYLDVCKKWGKTMPSLEVYSSKTGQHTTVKFDSEATTDAINRSINKAIDIVNINQEPVPTPEPPAPNKVDRPSFVTGVGKVLKATDRESRTFEEVKAKYDTLYGANLNPPQIPWTGSDTGCDVGTYNDEDRQIGIKTVSFYRWLYGVGELVEDKAHNEGCMETSILLNRLGYITHYPPSDCQCNTEKGMEYAAKSQIGLGSVNSYGAVDGMIYDADDSNRILGHRRGVLSPVAKKIGIGLTSSGNINADNENGLRSYTVVRIDDPGNPVETPMTKDQFYAHPGPGPFPVNLRPNRWHIQSPLFKKDVGLSASDIELRVIRSDGIALTPTDIFLETERVMGDSLIFYITDKDLSLCVRDTSVKVQAYIKKLDTAIEYTIYFYDFTAEAASQVCFYNTDESKCPESIKDRYKPSQSLPSGKDPIIVYFAEEFDFSTPLNLNFAKQITLTGSGAIKGTIKIPAGTSVTAAISSEATYEIEYNPSTGEAGKLISAEPPSMITVLFTETEVKDNLDNIRSTLYEGPTTYVTFNSPNPETEYGFYIFNYQFFSSQHTVNSLIVSRKYITKLWDLYSNNCFQSLDPEHEFNPEVPITFNRRHIEKIRLLYCTQYATFQSSILPEGTYEYEIDVAGGSNQITISQSDELAQKASAIILTSGNNQYFQNQQHSAMLIFNFPSGVPKIVLTKFSIKTPETYSLKASSSDKYYFPNYDGTLPDSLSKYAPTFSDLPSGNIPMNRDLWYNTKEGDNTVHLSDVPRSVTMRPTPGTEEKTHVIILNNPDDYYTCLVPLYLAGYKGRVEIVCIYSKPDLTKINCNEVVIKGSENSEVKYDEPITESGKFEAENAQYTDLTLDEATAVLKDTTVESFSIFDSEVKITGNSVIKGEVSIHKDAFWPSIELDSTATFTPTSLTIHVGAEAASRTALDKPVFNIVSGLSNCEDVLSKSKLTGSDSGDYELKCVDNSLSAVGTEEIYVPTGGFENGDDDEETSKPGGGGNSSNQGTLEPGAIAGIVIGVFAAVAIAAVCVWFFVFNKKSEGKVECESDGSSEEKNEKASDHEV